MKISIQECDAVKPGCCALLHVVYCSALKMEGTCMI